MISDRMVGIWIILAGIFVFAMSPITANAADIIVNQTVPVGRYSLMDTRAIFAMRQRYWPNGEQIKVFTLADTSPLHKEFVKKNLNMFPHQLRRAWDRMIYSGTGVAPIQLDSEQEMIDRIARTPNSIGYLKNRPKNESIRSFQYQ